MQAQGEGRNNNPGSSAEEKIIGKVEKMTMKMEKGLQLRSIDGEE